MKQRLVILLLLMSVVAAACGDTTVDDDPTADIDPALAACEVGTPDCVDTGTIDGGGLPLADDDGGASVGFIVDDGLTVTEALATDATGPLAVQGFLLGDGEGWRLCEALAESFPPQCGSPFLTLPGFDSPSALAYLGGLPIEEDQSTSWMNDSVTLLGEVVDGSLVVDFLLMG